MYTPVTSCTCTYPPVTSCARLYPLSDPRVEDWLLMKNPLAILVFYFGYLLVVWLGPKLMTSRQPVQMKAVLIPYNFALQALSVYMCYEVSLMIYM